MTTRCMDAAPPPVTSDAVILHKPARVLLAALQSFGESGTSDTLQVKRVQALFAAIQAGNFSCVSDVIRICTADEMWTLAAALDHFRPDNPYSSMFADEAKWALSKTLDYAPRYDSPQDVFTSVWYATTSK
jgi:hypothetical protein